MLGHNITCLMNTGQFGGMQNHVIYNKIKMYSPGNIKQQIQTLAPFFLPSQRRFIVMVLQHIIYQLQ